MRLWDLLFLILILGLYLLVVGDEIFSKKSVPAKQEVINVLRPATQ